MPAHDDDLFRAQTFPGDNAAKADRAVSDDRHRAAGTNFGGDCRVMTSAHYIRERQERWQQSVILSDRQLVERSVRQRNTHRLGLRTRNLFITEEAAVDAGRLEPFATELASAVRPRERHDDEIASLNSSNVSANRFNDADRFMAHDAASFTLRHRFVRPKVAPADAGARDRKNGVCRIDDRCVTHVLDPNVAGAIHNSCSHKTNLLSNDQRPVLFSNSSG